MYTLLLRIGDRIVKVASTDPRKTLEEFQEKADNDDENVTVIKIIDEAIVEDALYDDDGTDPNYWDNVYRKAEVSGRDALVPDSEK